jgi:mono/diheme cytochrome c family protein
MIRKVLYLAVLSSFVLTACGESDSPADSEPNCTLAPVPAEYAGKTDPFGPEAAGEGAKIFKTNCETCHGPQGHGDGPAGAALDPGPKDLSKLQKVASDDYLFWRISEGKEGTSMVAWKGILTEEQIWQVISFIRSLK